MKFTKGLFIGTALGVSAAMMMNNKLANHNNSNTNSYNSSRNSTNTNANIYSHGNDSNRVTAENEVQSNDYIL